MEFHIHTCRDCGDWRHYDPECIMEPYSECPEHDRVGEPTYSGKREEEE